MRRLFSWIDVELIIDENRFAGPWPKWLVDASAYHDCLLLRVRPNTSGEDIQQQLGSWFGARLQDNKTIMLEAPTDDQRPLPVEIEETLDESVKGSKTFEPLFRKLSLLLKPPSDSWWPKAFPDATPPIVAFHSFKGGVGRTTELLSLLVALASRSETFKTLVIDADLEAPGITSLVQADRRMGDAMFSFADLLAVAHGDRSSGREETLDLAEYSLRKQFLGSGSKLLGEHFFLPAFRDQDQTLRLAIRPEHLLQVPGSEWIIGDLIGALARRLGVEIVLVDLRAGLSELSSPFLLDPRLRRVIVTTPSEQSIDGTSLTLKQLAKFVPLPDRLDLHDPLVIVSFVTEEISASGQLESLLQRLYTSYSDLSDDVVEPDLPRLRTEQTSFATELLYLNSFTDAITRLKGSSVVKIMNQIADEFLLKPSDSHAVLDESRIKKARTGLQDLAKRLEYAESGKGEKFLSIAPIRALAKTFEREAPVAVVVGSKGAGKTYICLQLVRAKTWSNFVSAVSNEVSGSVNEGLVWPFLQSKNLQQVASQLVSDCKRQTAEALAFDLADFSTLATEDGIRTSLQHEKADETWWRFRWFDLVARSVGIKSAAENEAASRLVDYLRAKNRKMVLVLDGLEDLFQGLESQPTQQVALRALLQGLPNQLKEIPNCPLGIVVFIRADLVRTAIRQNVGQFESLYDSYALRWNEEEALRLATWIAREVDAPIALPASRPLEFITGDEAKTALLPVWGRKLGPDNSREARTAEWVIAALSDFRGQIQARDLVRFFRYAAENSFSAPITDRVLTPRAIRDAIQPCSEEKIREIMQEIPPLRGILENLQKATDRKIPFDAAASGLSVDQIRFLETTGVLMEDRGEYFMPEIFRLGMGFQLREGARPRVLSLARRVAGKSSL